MDVFEVESSVRGHHVYMQESFHRRAKERKHPYAVAIVKRNSWAQGSWPKVGHVPRILAAYYIKQT